MSKIVPSYEHIENLKVKPTEEELNILNFLREYPDDSLEVYYKPFLNGEKPDIAIIKKNYGVFLITVKDWDLNNYRLVDNSKQKSNLKKIKWFLKEDNTQILSPFSQVEHYKNNIYSFHIEDLAKMKALNSRMYTIVKCGVFFSKATDYELRKKYGINFDNNNQKQYIKVLSKDTLNNNNFNDLLNSLGWNKKYQEQLFTEELYKKFVKKFIPPIHYLEEGEDFPIDTRKNRGELFKSSAGSQKIKGVVGSGKTTILAMRAINAYKRTNKPVLILTYNITLKNYIKDKIAKVKAEFPWNNFIVLNYHYFINMQLNKVGIYIIPPPIDYNKEKKEEYFEENYYSNETLFENHKNELEKYSAIFIDEAQDYRYEWFVILKSFFLEENGEFVIFCDEKQNIYGRDLDSEKKVKTNIPGKWNKIETLDASYRSNENLVIIADKFQKEFLRNKYEYEKIKSKNQRLPFEKRITNYYYIDDKYEHKNDLIANLVINEYNNLSVNSDDVCVLSSFKEDLRYIEYKFRTSFKEDTHTTFLEFELYNELKEIYSKDGKCEEWWKKFCDEVERIENAYKFNFKLHSRQIKFSTIHSFKGLESYAVILIINSKDSEELIYTGITRARESLIVINNGNKKYDDFFRKNMQFQHLASIVA